MALTKNFLQKKSEFIEIPRFRLIVGILIGFSFSFVLYSLLYIVRECFRILSVNDTYDLWLMTDKEVHFYNLFFALISLIFGQSLCFTFWFDQPKPIFKKQNYRKTSILNDQRVLNYYFLLWFSKIAFLFVIFFGLAFPGGFYVFNLYPNYNYLFILLVIVLYFQTWNTIRLTFKRKSLQWMFASMLILVVLAFGLSRINLIDYKALNRHVLKNNIYSNYTLELPETNSYERVYTIKNIYLVHSKEKYANPKPIILIDNEIIPLEEFRKKITEVQSLLNQDFIASDTYRLHIHKTIKMGFVEQIQGVLTKSGVARIAYAVLPTNLELDKRYYYQQDFSFPMNLPNLNAPKVLKSNMNIFEINQTNSGECLINTKTVQNSQIKNTLKNIILHNPDYGIIFNINPNIDFSTYFGLLSTVRETVRELNLLGLYLDM